MRLLKKFYTDITSSKDIVSNFVNQELTVKYKRSFLGFFWSLLNPVAMMTITAIVFASIMRFNIRDFTIFLYAGLLPWGFFSISSDFGGQSIINNEGFIKKIYISKIVFPFSAVSAQFINMLFSMGALFIIMIFLGAKISFALLFLPVAFFLMFFFTFGVVLVLATLNVYFRDMRHLIGVIINAWYFLTPILYPIKMIPEHMRKYFLWNPAYYLIDMFRAPIYEGVVPDVQNILIAFGVTCLVFFVGLFYFYKNENDFIYRL